jgi:hypothetical protein
LEPPARPSVKPPKAKPKVQRNKEHPTSFLAHNNPSNLMTKILSNFYCFYERKKIDGLSTIVWVSSPIQSSSPWTKSYAMQTIWRAMAFGLWPLMWRVERPNLRFLQWNWWKSTASRTLTIVPNPCICSHHGCSSYAYMRPFCPHSPSKSKEMYSSAKRVGAWDSLSLSLSTLLLSCYYSSHKGGLWSHRVGK